jgi:hypothetical protein
MPRRKPQEGPRLRLHSRIYPLDLRPFQRHLAQRKRRRRQTALRWLLVLTLAGLLGLTLGLLAGTWTTGNSLAWFLQRALGL